jgi:thiol-disulfide isomerase/thioredoxin
MKKPSKSFWIGLVIGIPLGIVILVLGLYLYMISKAPKPPDPQNLEAMLGPPPVPARVPMDYDWRVQGLDGQEIHMTEMKGKVIFLNFWATWCFPCVVEMPTIQRLYDAMKNEEIAFLCVSEEATSRIAMFMREKGFTFPVYTLVGMKPQVFRTRGIPATFIASQEGDIVFRHIGVARWDDDTCVKFLTGLLNSNPQ